MAVVNEIDLNTLSVRQPARLKVQQLRGIVALLSFAHDYLPCPPDTTRLR